MLAQGQGVPVRSAETELYPVSTLVLRGVQQFVRGGDPLPPIFAKVFTYNDLIVRYSKIMT